MAKEIRLHGRSSAGGLSRARASLRTEDQDLLKLLGRTIRGHRIQSAMTQKELADRLLLGEATVTRIEDGDPRVAMGYYLGACRLVGVQLLDATALIHEMQHFDASRKRASKPMAIDDRFS